MKTEKPIYAFWWSSQKAEKLNFENFGDVLTKYLLEKLTGRKVKWINICASKIIRLFQPRPIYVVTGSILHLVHKHCIVWGAGVIRKNERIERMDCRAVRGPRSQERLKELGYPVPEAVGDPALLLPLLYQSDKKPSFKLGIIPHYIDFEDAQQKYGAQEGIKLVDLRKGIEEVVDEISNCTICISSSLHGVITAHAYGIPCLWFRMKNQLAGDDIKFEDYFASVNIEPYAAFQMPSTNELEKLIELVQREKKLNLPQLDINILQRALLQSCPLPITHPELSS